MARSRLHELSEHGVSVWVDSLSREMLETGHLARLMDEDAVVGVTSNPTIFEKALSTGDWYDEQLRAELVRAFLAAEFDGGERYVLRLEKIEEMEKRYAEDTTAAAR